MDVATGTSVLSSDSPKTLENGATYTPLPEVDDIETDSESLGLLYSNGSLEQDSALRCAPLDGFEDMSMCASPGSFEPNSQSTSRPRRKRGGSKGATNSESLAGMLRRGTVKHQLGLSLNLLLLVGMSWCLFPTIRHKLDAFLWLSYRQADTEGIPIYGQGPRDLVFVGAFVVLFTGVRAFMLDYVLMPAAGALGIGKQKGKVR